MQFTGLLYRAGWTILLFVLNGCNLFKEGLWPFESVKPHPDIGEQYRYIRSSTMKAVQIHLLPGSLGSPGALEVNANQYLLNIIHRGELETEQLATLKAGLLQINQLARQLAFRSFINLDPEQKETCLRTLEKNSTGRGFLIIVLQYLVEALMSDPVYGGNPQKIAWNWLHFEPGFPSPPVGKRYFEL